MASNGNRERRWRDLPPMKNAPERVGPEDDPFRVSQTFLRTDDRCPRSAALYLVHDGGPASHALDRGSIFHEWVAKAIRHLMANDETQIPPEVAKDLLLEVLEEHLESVTTAKERDGLRQMVYHFAGAVTIDPEAIVALESTFTLRLGKWTVRGRIDLAELTGPARIDVTDWKTSWNMPTAEQFEGDFQTMLYALAVAFGELEETGLRIGEGIEEFGLSQKFPRYVTEDGLATRSCTVTRQQLLDFRLDLEGQLARLEKQLETGKWPAIPGSHCSECVAPSECPLPRHLRPDSQMALYTMDDAEKIAEWIVVQSNATRRAKARLKKYAENEGLEAIPAGRDLEFVFVYRESEEIIDREAMFAGVQGAVEYGLPFDRDQHVRTKKSTKFEKRKVKKEEPS